MKKIKSHILLVNPFFYDFTAFDLWAKPLGLLEIGKMLLEFGFRVTLIDTLFQNDPIFEEFPSTSLLPPQKKKYGTGTYWRKKIAKPEFLKNFPRYYYHYGMTEEMLEKKLKKLSPPPDLIMVTSIMTYWWEGVRDTISTIKKIFPNIPLILGGIYPTLLPEHAQKNTQADSIVQGTVTREKLLLILKKFFPDSKLENKNQEAIQFYPYKEIEYAPLRLSKGCPRNCHYCASKYLHPEFYQLNLKDTLLTFEYLYKKGIKHYAFYDDFLLYRKEKQLFSFAEKAMEISKGKVSFHTPNAIFLNDIDRYTAQFLFKNNFLTLRFGFETASIKLSKKIGFKINLADFSQKIAYLRESGYSQEQLGVYLLVGLPEQTPEDVLKSIDFVKSAGAKPYLAEFSPVPKTLEYEKAKKNSPVDFWNNPTLQNKSLLPLRNPIFTYDLLNRLKNYCYQK